MKAISPTCSDCFRNRNAITLVEVVVGLALLGGLLAVAIVGSSHHQRQLHHAKDKRQAVDRLDQFMVKWAQSNYALQEATAAAASVPVNLRIEDIDSLSESFYESKHASVLLVVGRQRTCDLPGACIRRIEAFTGPSNRPATWLEVVMRQAR